MKYKSVLTRIMIAPLFLGLVTSCYDLGELNENPYEIKDATVGGNDTDTGDDGTKYSDINIDFKVSKEDSLALQSELASAASTFRNLIIRLRPILVMIFMPVMLLITRKIMQEILLTIIILTVGRVKDGNIFIMTVVMSIVVYYELLSLMMSPKDTRMRFI